MKKLWAGCLAAFILATPAVPVGHGEAKGMLTYTSKGKALNLALLKAYLITGPDAVDEKVIIRRLIFTSVEIDTKLQACGTMKCADIAMGDGFQIDLIPGPRYNYWLTLNGQLVQYSGTEKPEALTASANTASRVTGKLAFDGTRMGGPIVDVTFDAPLLKAFTKAR